MLTPESRHSRRASARYQNVGLRECHQIWAVWLGIDSIHRSGVRFLHREERVDILFASEKLRQLCEKADRATRKFGPKAARLLRARLADLVAVDRVGELVAGDPHPLKGDRKGQFALALDEGLRLVFDAVDDPPPQTTAGDLDWGRVCSVRIVAIENYHHG